MNWRHQVAAVWVYELWSGIKQNGTDLGAVAPIHVPRNNYDLPRNQPDRSLVGLT
jgi:hypothetical protein